MKPRVYLKAGFWEQLSQMKGLDAISAMVHLADSLAESNVCTDISEKYINKDVFLKRIFKNKGNNKRCDINKVLARLNEQSKTADLCSVYLLEDQEVCNDYQMQYGILCLTPKDVCEHPSFFCGEAIMYKKGTVADRFEECKKPLSTPCNSLLVIDPYLFENYHDIDNVLIPLLNQMLPQESSFRIPFHISIFSLFSPTKFTLDDLLRKMNNEVLKVGHNKIDISLTTYQVAKTGTIEIEHIEDAKDGEKKYLLDELGNYITGDFHSRHIITNNMIVTAEDGFDIFVWNKNKQRVECGKWARFLFVWPSLDDNSRKDIDTYYHWLKICYENVHDSPPQKCKCIGGCGENRLLDFWALHLKEKRCCETALVNSSRGSNSVIEKGNHNYNLKKEGNINNDRPYASRKEVNRKIMQTLLGYEYSKHTSKE